MEQTALESKIETVLNISSGFVISYGMWLFVVNPLIEHGYLTINDAFSITMIFTVTSVIRSYYWRRFFAKGLHRIVHRWISKFMQLTGW